MPTIYINTTKIDDNLFELYHQKQVGFEVTYWSEERQAQSRIEAVLLNTGLAAKYLVENYPSFDKLLVKTIALMDDREEQTEREQYEVYKILSGLKYGKIEGNLYQFSLRFGNELEQWLKRIVYLVKLGNIKIGLYYMKNNEFCLDERAIKAYNRSGRSLENRLSGFIK